MHLVVSSITKTYDESARTSIAGTFSQLHLLTTIVTSCNLQRAFLASPLVQFQTKSTIIQDKTLLVSCAYTSFVYVTQGMCQALDPNIEYVCYTNLLITYDVKSFFVRYFWCVTFFVVVSEHLIFGI